MFPNYDLDVQDITRAIDMAIGVTLNASVVQINNDMTFSVNGDIQFISDVNDDNSVEFIGFYDSMSPLLVVTTNGDVGVFNNTPEVNFHLESISTPSTVLLQNNNGTSFIQLVSGSESSIFQLNKNGVTSVGFPLEGVLGSSNDIILNSDGNNAVFISTSNISIGADGWY